MARVVVPLASAAGPSHGETLRFLRAELRKRQGGRIPIVYGGGGAEFEAGYGLSVVYDGRQVNITVRLRVSRDKTRVEIWVEDTSDTLSLPELRDLASSLMLAAVDAARANETRSFWMRRYAYYVGRRLDGWYELPGFRIGPAPMSVENQFDPHNKSGLQVLVLDVRVDAIDSADALERAPHAFTRHVAHAAFCLGLPLRWPSDFPAVLPRSAGEVVAVRQWSPGIAQVEPNAAPFDDGARQGRWASHFVFPWREQDRPQVAGAWRFPRDAVRVLRRINKLHRIDKNRELPEAFDSCARLYHLACLVPQGFRSAGLALMLAAVEALAGVLPECNGTGGASARFTAFMTLYERCTRTEAAELYGRWRSGIFHDGRFAPIDGAHIHIDFIDRCRP